MLYAFNAEGEETVFVEAVSMKDAIEIWQLTREESAEEPDQVNLISEEAVLRRKTGLADNLLKEIREVLNGYGESSSYEMVEKINEYLRDVKRN